MKKILLIMVFGLFLFGCSSEPDNDADKEQAKQTADLMSEAQRQVGMPGITNFQERKLAKYIMEQCDREDLVCYAYIVNLEGELIFIGKCMGYGLPYSVQFTNPQRTELVRHFGDRQVVTLPQADPSGLFKPDGLSATWLMMIDEKGDTRPVYIEPQIIVSPFKLTNETK